MKDINYNVNRQGSYSLKWDCMEMAGGRDGDLPFWIADMEYSVADEIQEKLIQRAKHPVYGYTYVPERYRQAVCEWYNSRHEAGLTIADIVPAASVLSSMVVILSSLIKKGESVFLFTPVYPQFYSVIRKAGGKMETVVLMVGESVDWDHVEEKLKRCKAALFCNPHNPLGKVWKREECVRFVELCERHGIFILSDEVHGDMALFGNRYHCMVSIEAAAPRTIVFTSGAKTFNIAGLGGANLLVKDPGLRKLVSTELQDMFLSEINIFAMEGMMAAYENGGEWLDCIRTYIEANYIKMNHYFKQYIPALDCSKQEGTYLAWIDARQLGEYVEDYIQSLEQKQHMLVDNGRRYGKGGEGYIRMNVACQKQMLLEGLNRLARHYNEFEEKWR